MAYKAAKKVPIPPTSSSPHSATAPSSSSPSATTASSPVSAAPAAAAPVAAPPTSAWGKANPLIAAAHAAAAAPSLPSASGPTSNGTTHPAPDKAKDGKAAAAASPATSPVTAAAVSAVSPPSASATSPASSAAAAGSASPSAGAGPSASALSTALQLGSVVRVTTALQEVLEGTVYVYDASASLLALEVQRDGSTDVSLLNAAALTGVELVRRSAAPAHHRVLPELDHAKLAQREQRALAHRQSEASKIGVGVSARGQRMFDSLSKLYGASWEGSAIVLMDGMRLAQPYSAEQLSGGSQQQRQRIVKTIEAQKDREDRH